jgi:hypothetical protein
MILQGVKVGMKVVRVDGHIREKQDSRCIENSELL